MKLMSFAKTEKTEMERHSLIKACNYWVRGREHCQRDSMGEDPEMQDVPEMELRANLDFEEKLEVKKYFLYFIFTIYSLLFNLCSVWCLPLDKIIQGSWVWGVFYSHFNENHHRCSGRRSGYKAEVGLPNYSSWQKDCELVLIGWCGSSQTVIKKAKTIPLALAMAMARPYKKAWKVSKA